MKGVKNMSNRDYLRQNFVFGIEEHLENSLEPNTIKMYQKILDHGIDKERAVELLAFHL